MREFIKIVTILIVIAGLFFQLGMIVGEALHDEPELPAPVIENVTYLQAGPVTDVSELQDYEMFTATAYCGCIKCNEEWSDGAVAQSATGATLQQGLSVAADFNVLAPFTQIEVSGVGLLTVHDCGAAIEGNELDIYFENHEDAEAFGVQEVQVRICE